MVSTASILGVGFVFGLKHALDADHLAAVSTLVSERTSWLNSSLTGALWGVGHTASLLLAGIAVIFLHVKISDRVAFTLEFAVALMLIGLGLNALRVVIRGGHVHVHAHGDRTHLHSHRHGDATETHTHHRIGTRPLLVGMVHGLAGSAALMLVVLSTIPSPLVGLAYIGSFGVGSIGSMSLIGLLISLPAQLSTTRFARAHVAMRTLAGLFSLGLGLFMAYQLGVVEGLLV